VETEGFEKRSVLLVGGEHSEQIGLRTSLVSAGFAVVEAGNGENLLPLVRRTNPDAVFLDFKLPGFGAIEVTRMIREISPRLPVIVLSTADHVDRKVEAFEAGADDYITKPFGPRELLARLRAAVRRYRFSESDRSVLTVGAIKLDPVRYLASKNGQRIHLTPREFNLLHQLMLHAGETLSHAQLLRVIWGPQFIYKTEYLRTFVRSLRVKIEDEPRDPRYLVTDPQFGYRIAAPVAAGDPPAQRASEPQLFRNGYAVNM
jgi:two-component system, OmpR family, KDP operon response regulator KdpE